MASFATGIWTVLSLARATRGLLQPFEEAGRDEEAEFAVAPTQLAPAGNVYFKVGQAGRGETQIDAAVGSGAEPGDQLGGAWVVSYEEDVVGAVVGLLKNVQQRVRRGGVDAVVPAEVAGVADQLCDPFSGLARAQGGRGNNPVRSLLYSLQYLGDSLQLPEPALCKRAVDITAGRAVLLGSGVAKNCNVSGVHCGCALNGQGQTNRVYA